MKKSEHQKLAFIISFLVGCFAFTPSFAQTPIANRVHAAANRLGLECRTVAKYTDNKRHCLYYSSSNRLFCYDVWTDKTHEVRFSNEAYQCIVETYLSPKGRYLFIDVECNENAASGFEDHRQLWIYDTFSGKFEKVGAGFDVSKGRDSFIIKKATHCLNPKAPVSQQRWMVRDHYYYMDNGRNIWAKDEYEYKH